MKVQDKYFYFLVASLVTVVTMSYLFFATPLSNVLGKSTWALFSVTAIYAFFYNVYKANLWTSRAGRFKHHFGINPPNVPGGDWKRISALQPIVDEYLKDEAIVLHRVCVIEDELLKKKPENLDQAMKRADQIMSQAVVVESEKKYFWDLWNLAWEWGFEVWDSHKDYISAFDRAGKEKSKKQF